MAWALIIAKQLLESLKKLAYITDLECRPGGGGSYAINWHIQDQLRKHFDLQTGGAIVPCVSAWRKTISRFNRYVLNRPTAFNYFSDLTLEHNAKQAAHQYQNGIDGVFFRSATRWSHCKPIVPYFVYLDVVFHTFFENTFDSGDFLKSDLDRIFKQEAHFLENAAEVFFESNWGLKKAQSSYSLSGGHYHVAGRGGLLEPPESDQWTGTSMSLLSIAMNFEQKGGDIIMQAFRKLKEEHPNLRWHIIGGCPSGDWESIEGIVYEGVLDPVNGDDLALYRQILSQAFLLIHPTREDTNPLVITEAAYFGCPSISVNRFAIPELVIDGKTGVLLDFPAEPDELAQIIAQLIDAPDVYQQMRQAAFEFARSDFEWDKVGKLLAQKIDAVLA